VAKAWKAIRSRLSGPEPSPDRPAVAFFPLAADPVELLPLSLA